jgi:hypothetical protein
MRNFLLYIWQLPQNLLGLCIVKFTKAKKQYLVYRTSRYRFGVSLGKYIIFGGYYTATSIKHEQGHQKQSLYLGPLYLIIIGLPSVTGNLLNRVIRFDYYRQPWEHWADILGGVKR